MILDLRPELALLEHEKSDVGEVDGGAKVMLILHHCEAVYESTWRTNMKAVTLRNLPPKLDRTIRQRARQKRVSVNKAVIALLEEHLGAPAPMVHFGHVEEPVAVNVAVIEPPPVDRGGVRPGPALQAEGGLEEGERPFAKRCRKSDAVVGLPQQACYQTEFLDD